MTQAPTTALPDLSGMPGLDPEWSRTVTTTDDAGTGHTWHVLDNGVDPVHGTLLCFHGNPTWSYLWRGLLAGAPEGWRVVAMDHLGMGWSERLPEPRHLAQRVRDLGDLSAALGITGPVVTVGHDWGGILSLGWALDHRDQLRGTVLCNTAVEQPPGDRGPALIRLAHLPLVRKVACVRTPAFVRGTSALSGSGLSRSGLSRSGLSRSGLPADVRRALAAPYATPERRRSVGDFVADIPFAEGHPSAPARKLIADGVRTLDTPALLLWGPRDPVFGETYLADLRDRLPHAQLHRYEGASHLVTEDAPHYADTVAQWVQDVVEGRRPPGRVEPGPVEPERIEPTGQEHLWSALDRRAADASAAYVEVGGDPGTDTVSWAQLRRRVHDLAAGLAAGGVRPGDRVALLVEPSADLTAAVYAVWRAGAVIVVADKGLGLPGMRRALRSARVDHVIGGAPGLAAARAMGLPGRRFATGSLPGPVRRSLRVVADLDELARTGRRSPTPAEAGPDQDCAVVFTSGATGPAKGVVYRHGQVLAQLDLLRTTYDIGPEDRAVAAFAPFALLGPGLGIGSAAPDIDVTAPGTLTAAGLADAVAAVDATIVFASPAALRNVEATAAGLTPQQRSALSGVRLLMSAGAPVPAALLRSLRSVLPAAEAHTPYGMTEALPVTDVSLGEIDEAGDGDGVCVGRPLKTVEVQVSPLSPLGAADGPLTSTAGTTGEICVSAGHVKDRYDALWATERSSARDPGWHRTGDVGHLDEQGRLWVEGRLPHVVTTAAGPVTPVGVEQRLERLPGVRSAAVVGVGPIGAQVLAAVVVPSGADGPAKPGRGSRRLRLADAALTAAVRGSAGTDVAAVLVTPALPLDIRHASKIDRAEVARRAARALAGR